MDFANSYNNEERLELPVEVAVVFRPDKEPGKRGYPAKMRFRGQEIAFAERCLYHPTAKGTRMIHVFDMSDGINDYRLEFDAESLVWTLIATMEGHDENAD
ncbi:MAG TPA: hypothetical protein VLG27_03290 [Candidatus Saccharimonadia bacterium]|nr:hypothetical protein [Patescibacteria group bacterium]HSX45999.1 hypothetical protein [Candidatus Saccharimonadia bacterium]